MPLKYLITGATGGLGSRVLAFLVANVPRSEYAATSSSEANRALFEKDGIAFRVANYDDPVTLDTAFKDVENLFFVSTENFDTPDRIRQHRNVVEAAERASVGHVWYTSLAFGGLRSDSKIGVQKAHLETERILQASNVTYTSIREGLYAEIFPIFLQWYPDTKTVYAADSALMTFTSRAELGEANGKLLIRGGFENKTILLTANEALQTADLVKIINETTNRQVELVLTTPEKYVKFRKENGSPNKPESYWRQVFNWLEGFARGDTEMTDPLMGELLGREPKSGSEAIRELLEANPHATWPETESGENWETAKQRNPPYEDFWGV